MNQLNQSEYDMESAIKIMKAFIIFCAIIALLAIVFIFWVAGQIIKSFGYFYQV